MTAWKTTDDDTRARALFAAAIVMIGIVTVVHYVTDMRAVAFHNVYRRLYYIPIVIAAFAFGLRGGLAAAVLSSVAYIPHAFFMMHRDPAPPIDKVLEIVLYLAIGGLTGWLVEVQQRIQRALKRSLAERDVLEEQLVRAGKLSALGQLTAGLAHEIRNPLASIQGSAETLADEFDAEHRKYRMAQLLLKEIGRLKRVVNDFLQFARPGTPERTTPVDLIDVAREVASLTQHQASSAGIDVAIEDDASAVVEADANQVSQVVLNLFLNAYQALEETPPEADTPTLSVRVSSREVGERRFRCLGVSDNGPGIPDDVRDDIFNPYFTTREGGTGLGLTISSRIMESHEGFIDVEASEDGTTFWVCFPEET